MFNTGAGNVNVSENTHPSESTQKKDICRHQAWWPCHTSTPSLGLANSRRTDLPHHPPLRPLLADGSAFDRPGETLGGPSPVQQS